MNPEKDFEIDKKKLNSNLNFSYSWKPRIDNLTDRTTILNEYKDKLGWYIELYDQKKSQDILGFFLVKIYFSKGKFLPTFLIILSIKTPAFENALSFISL